MKIPFKVLNMCDTCKNRVVICVVEAQIKFADEFIPLRYLADPDMTKDYVIACDSYLLKSDVGS